MTDLHHKIPEPEGILIPVEGVHLPGDLVVPNGSRGLVIFAHGSGSSRRSHRNQVVARALQVNGLATLLFDLLTEAEDHLGPSAHNPRFDIPLLAARLAATAAWAHAQPALGSLPIGLFGSSTGAAAALLAATRLNGMVWAIVSRSGRPDLAGDALAEVKAPTLLIAGGEDDTVIQLNQHAQALMKCRSNMVIIPGATHLFEELGALEQVMQLAADWFGYHLTS